MPLLVGPWAGMSRNRARAYARKHARDHRLPRAINYGAVCMESLHIGRDNTIRREIARVIALPRAIGVHSPRCSVTSLHGDLKIKKIKFCFSAIFSCYLSRFCFWPLGVPLLVGPWTAPEAHCKMRLFLLQLCNSNFTTFGIDTFYVFPANCITIPIIL